MADRRAKNGTATAALVLGVIGLLAVLVPVFIVISVPCGVLAIVFGILGRRRANLGAEGGGSSVAGLVCGVLALILAIAVIVIPAS